MAELRTIPLAEVARACYETSAAFALLVRARCRREQRLPDRTTRALAGHNTAGDCWLVIHGKVYDGSQFMTDHPGGPESMLGACADASASARARVRVAPRQREEAAAQQHRDPFRLFPAFRRRVCRAQRDERVRRFVPLFVGAQDDGQVRV